jgi:hypothetical protein
MKFYRMLVLGTLVAMIGLNTAQAIGLGGRGGVNSGNVEMGEPSKLRQYLEQKQAGQMGSNPALELGARAEMGSNPGIATSGLGNAGLNAQQPLLSAEPNGDAWKKRNAPREPVKTYNVNSIDSDGNIYFSPGIRSSRIRD